MTTSNLLRSLCITLLLFGLSACSGGGEQEPIEPQAVNEPTTPTEPNPEPPAEPEPPSTPPPTTPPPTTPPPTTPPPTTPPPTNPPPPPPPAASPVGIYHGHTKQELRDTTCIILPNLKTWCVMSTPGNPDWASGVIFGVLKVTGLNWTMTNGAMVQKDFRERSFLPTGKGSFEKGIRFRGDWNVRYDLHNPLPPLYPTEGFDGIYDLRSTEKFDPKKVAGRYVGLFLPLEEAEITLDENGTFAGRSAGGCTFDGTMTPNGPAAEIAVEFDGPPCDSSSRSMKGVLHVDLQTGTLTTAAFSLEGNQGIQGLLLIGKRQ